MVDQPIPESPRAGRHPSGELRVEALAEAAGVSVDTVRFYQKRRLLPPPRREGRVAWYGPEHVERLARIRDLQARGLTLALIGRLLRGELDATDEPLAAAVAGAAAEEPGTDHLDLEGLAARSGVPAALLESLEREGLLVPRVGAGDAPYTSVDADVVRAGLALLEQGLPLPELLALARAHHDATRAIAERAVAMFDDHIRTPIQASDLDAAEKAERIVDAFRALLPAVSGLVAQHFRRVLLAVAQEHLEQVGDEHELAAAGAEAERHLEVVWPR